MWFELTDTNTCNVWNVNLLSLYLDTFNVLQLSECPSLPHVFLHFPNMLNEYLVHITLLIDPLLFEFLNPCIDLITFIYLSI